MAYFCEQGYLKTHEVSIIEISSDSDGDTSGSPLNDTEKENSPDPPVMSKPSIIAPVVVIKKRKSSGRKKNKRIPCQVCIGRFGTQANLDLHMKMHWNVFYKMEALFDSITNKVKDKDQINKKCECSRCVYESRDDEKPYEITQNFICIVCDSSFYTANKLSKHMDKHREIYFKMKKLEEENSLLFLNRLPTLQNTIIDTKTQEEVSIVTCIQKGDIEHLR